MLFNMEENGCGRTALSHNVHLKQYAIVVTPIGAKQPLFSRQVERVSLFG